MSSPLPSATASLTVGDRDLASGLGIVEDRFPAVFSTTRMIALMEIAASRCLAPLVREGELSVGVSVEVRHTAATPPGVEVIATARFLRMEGKLYRFEVTAADPAGEIGRGEHVRAIVSTERLLAGAARRFAAPTEV